MDYFLLFPILFPLFPILFTVYHVNKENKGIFDVDV